MSRTQPYPEYRGSDVPWVRRVPAGWLTLPLYSVLRESKTPNLGMVESNLLSLSYGRIVRKDIKSTEGLLPESFETYQVVEPGDIVFRFTDLQNDKRSLRSALVGERGIITSAYAAATPRGIQPEYAAYLMRSYDLTKVFYGLGGGVRQSLKFEDVRRVPMLVPSPEEQRAIADYLDRETAQIDALIGKQERLIETLRERRAAVVERIVTKGLEGRTMQDSGLQWVGEMPAHWAVKRISWLFRSTGSGTTPAPDDIVEPASETIPWVTTGELREHVITSTKKAVTSETVKSLSALRVYPPGTLLMAMYGATIGRLAVLGISAVTNQSCCAMCGPVETHVRFVEYALQAAKPHLILMASGGGQPNINQDKVRSLRIPVPPLDEQRRIADYLDEQTAKIDALIAKAERFIEVSKERRAALITAAVTGQIDVRGEVA